MALCQGKIIQEGTFGNQNKFTCNAPLYKCTACGTVGCKKEGCSNVVHNFSSCGNCGSPLQSA